MTTPFSTHIAQDMGDVQIDSQFHALVDAMRTRAVELLESNHGLVFQTQLPGLTLDNVEFHPDAANHLTPGMEVMSGRERIMGVFLGALDESLRQQYNCNACASFMKNYGNLAIVEYGTCRLLPLLWDVETAPEIFKPGVQAVINLFEKAKIVRVFYTDAEFLGEPVKGGHEHMAIPTGAMRAKPLRSKTAGANMQDSIQTRELFARSIGQFSDELLASALNLFQNDKLLICYPQFGQYLSTFIHFKGILQKAKAPDQPVGTYTRAIWAAVGMLPTGVLRIKNSVLGRFLEDLSNGKSMAECVKSFGEDVHPSQYKRPQVAPSEGTIEQAEKIIAELGLTTALERRFATEADLPDSEIFWRPTVEAFAEAAPARVFGHLQAKDATPKPVGGAHVTDAGKITWERFRTEILPKAKTLAVELSPIRPYAFGGLFTAVHADAGLLLSYDRDEQRNPVSMYLYANGVPPRAIALESSGAGIITVPVRAIMSRPEGWFGVENHREQMDFLLLEGARETNNVGLGLFPDILRRDLHGVRSVIEAYSNGGKPDNVEDSIAGLWLSRIGGEIGIELVITNLEGFKVRYTIDRSV
jgi:hypothetical protein